MNLVMHSYYFDMLSQDNTLFTRTVLMPDFLDGSQILYIIDPVLLFSSYMATAAIAIKGCDSAL